MNLRLVVRLCTDIFRMFVKRDVSHQGTNISVRMLLERTLKLMFVLKKEKCKNWEFRDSLLCSFYRVFQTEFYYFENIYKFIHRTCAVF
jgi:hypothetical protein